jgi:dTDP-4-dehydrorhamnose reductase
LNILVTGSNGQLGNELKFLSSSYPQDLFVFTDKEELDITNINSLEDFFKKNKINIVINCAAYTAVDKAEEEKESAKRINTIACKNLALISNKYSCALIHISTDYVFNGKTFIPYTEDDKTNPVSVYGKTKLDGEKQIIKKAKKFIIIRTGWLYSSYGINFVKTIIGLAKKNENIKIISDQVGTPTYANDLALAIIKIIFNIKDNNVNQIYNFSNEGIASWYDFAHEILALSGIVCKIFPIQTKDYICKAKRPYYSVLNKNKIKKNFNIEIRHWRDALKDSIEKIKRNIK